MIIITITRLFLNSFFCAQQAELQILCATCCNTIGYVASKTDDSVNNGDIAIEQKRIVMVVVVDALNNKVNQRAGGERSNLVAPLSCWTAAGSSPVTNSQKERNSR